MHISSHWYSRNSMEPVRPKIEAHHMKPYLRLTVTRTDIMSAVGNVLRYFRLSNPSTTFNKSYGIINYYSIFHTLNSFSLLLGKRKSSKPLQAVLPIDIESRDFGTALSDDGSLRQLYWRMFSGLFQPLASCSNILLQVLCDNNELWKKNLL